MSRDTVSDAAGQEPSDGATPQALHTTTGQLKKLKRSGMIVVRMPKIGEMAWDGGGLEKERKILCLICNVFQNEM